MSKMNLTAFCVIQQQDGSWTLNYRAEGETGYNIHSISNAYAKRLMGMVQGEPDEGGFTIPFLSQKNVNTQQLGASLARAVRSPNLATAPQTSPEMALEASMQRLTGLIDRLTATGEA